MKGDALRVRNKGTERNKRMKRGEISVGENERAQREKDAKREVNERREGARGG